MKLLPVALTLILLPSAGSGRSSAAGFALSQREILIVTQSFSFRGLMFLAEVPATGFVAGQCVSAHQFGKFQEISDSPRPF